MNYGSPKLTSETTDTPMFDNQPLVQVIRAENFLASNREWTIIDDGRTFTAQCSMPERTETRYNLQVLLDVIGVPP
jgi:hypothetical protein